MDKDKIKIEVKKVEAKKPEPKKNPYAVGTARHQTWNSKSK